MVPGSGKAIEAVAVAPDTAPLPGAAYPVGGMIPAPNPVLARGPALAQGPAVAQDPVAAQGPGATQDAVLAPGPVVAQAPAASPPAWIASPAGAQRAATGSLALAPLPDELVPSPLPLVAEPAEPAPPDPGPTAPGSFRDVAALVAASAQPMLHAHLLHNVHLVRFAPPVIELRPESGAPRDLAPRLAALLGEATGTRWTIALSAAPGEATLSEQGSAAAAARSRAAADHPLVRAILDAFPGARLGPVRDSTVDAYGLPAAASGFGLAPGAPAGPLAGEAVPEYGDPDAPADPWGGMPGDVPGDMPEFAPPDAEFADGTMEDDR